MVGLIIGGAFLLAGAIYLSRESRYTTRTLVAAAPIPPPAPPTLPAAVGRVDATAQQTPWTCGPASLRAVLGHYGRDVTEVELSTAACLAPALGATPEGLAKAAEVYGCHAGAFQMNRLGELVDLLAARIPPICIVDSWTRPGEVGHYVVVSRIDPKAGLITVMDPHTEGNWRVLTVQDFDARWWAKRRGPDGQPVRIPRLCVIVQPGPGMAVVGAEASPVTPPDAVPRSHGRTVVCKKSGGAGAAFGHFMRGAIKVADHALITAFSKAFTGGAATKLLTGAFDRIYDLGVHKTIPVDELFKWINQATNVEVVLWGMKRTKDNFESCAIRDTKAKQKLGATFDAAGITGADFAGDAVMAAEAAFRFHLSHWGFLNVDEPSCVYHHILQALAMTFYGGNDPAGVLPWLEAWLKQPHGAKPAERRAWMDSALLELQRWRDAHGGVPAGVDAAVAAAQKAADQGAAETAKAKG